MHGQPDGQTVRETLAIQKSLINTCKNVFANVFVDFCRSGVLRKSKKWTQEKIKTRNDIFSTSHSARMLQFKVVEAILKKYRLQRLQIGQDGDDPAIRKLLSQFHGKSGIVLRVGSDSFSNRYRFASHLS